MKSNNLEKKVNFLTKYSILSTLIFLIIGLSSFNGSIKKEYFDEIDVKRINLLTEDGDLRMVISNSTRQHSGRMDGVDFPKRKRNAGIIFFNDEGDECGGLIHGGKVQGEKGYAGMSFTMDQHKNDQVIQIVNSETYENGKSSIYRGFVVNERPVKGNLRLMMDKYTELMKIENEQERSQKIKALIDKEGGANRLFLGKKTDEESGLFLKDKKGNYRMKIFIDSLGNPKIQTLDLSGKVKNILLD